MPAEYCNNILYPIQDQVLALFRDTPFYLTGGTAPSRGYYRHRYSDVLDFFVNDLHEFERLISRAVKKLRSCFAQLDIVAHEAAFCRLFVSPEQLKIEMLNDVPAHIEGIIEHPLLGHLDSRENILANKITALVDRAHPKDVADIYSLLKDGLSLRNALTDADSKAAGVTPLLVARILEEFPYDHLTSVNWISPVDIDEIKAYLTDTARTIVGGK